MSHITWSMFKSREVSIWRWWSDHGSRLALPSTDLAQAGRAAGYWDEGSQPDIVRPENDEKRIRLRELTSWRSRAKALRSNAKDFTGYTFSAQKLTVACGTLMAPSALSNLDNQIIARASNLTVSGPLCSCGLWISETQNQAEKISSNNQNRPEPEGRGKGKTVHCCIAIQPFWFQTHISQGTNTLWTSKYLPSLQVLFDLSPQELEILDGEFSHPICNDLQLESPSDDSTELKCHCEFKEFRRLSPERINYLQVCWTADRHLCRFWRWGLLQRCCDRWAEGETILGLEGWHGYSHL